MSDSTKPSPLIYKKIIAVLADISAIGKSRKNEQQRYSFRGIDDVYQEVHPLFAKHGIFTVPEVLSERSEERQSKAGSALIYRILLVRYTFFAEDGSSLQATVVGEGQDSGDKASNKAMSVAHKYALLQVFAVPTEEPKDPEIDSHELRPKPMPNALYSGNEAQKVYLREVFNDFGVVDDSVMRALAQKLLGTPMARAKETIKKELGL